MPLQQPMDQQLSRSRLRALTELLLGILFFWIILLLSPILILALVILTITISWSHPYQPQQRLRSRWDQRNQGSGATTSGGIRVRHYYSIGPAVEESAAGWGLGLWSGVKLGVGESTLDGALTNSSTSIVVDDSASFPASGTVVIDDERIAYTSNTSGTETLSGLTRGSDNTTAAAHSDGATVKDASDYTKWGASQTGDIVTAPGVWSLDNFGNKLIATIADGATFEWDSNATDATATRATIISGAPTASQFTLVSTPDRHLICFGTETNNWYNFYTRRYVY